MCRFLRFLDQHKPIIEFVGPGRGRGVTYENVRKVANMTKSMHVFCLTRMIKRRYLTLARKSSKKRDFALFPNVMPKWFVFYAIL